MSRPCLASNLQLVDARAGAILRAQRIDALSVDRTRAGHGIPGLTAPVPARCMEAEAREPLWQHLRTEATLSERMAAWRGLSENVYADFPAKVEAVQKIASISVVTNWHRAQLAKIDGAAR